MIYFCVKGGIIMKYEDNFIQEKVLYEKPIVDFFSKLSYPELGQLGNEEELFEWILRFVKDIHDEASDWNDEIAESIVGGTYIIFKCLEIIKNVWHDDEVYELFKTGQLDKILS